MKIGFLMECIAALAVSIVMALSWRADGEAAFGPLMRPMVEYSFLTCALVFGAVGLAIERARGHGPRPWGIGRLLWLLLGVACLLGWVWDTAWDHLRQQDPLASVSPLSTLIRHHSTQSMKVAWVPLALWISALLGSLPRDPKPDAREWVGRALGIALMVLYLYNEISSVFANGMLKIWWRH